MAQFWNHPVFTPTGLVAVNGATLIPTFWQGEFWWHSARIATRWSDTVYLASTTLFLLAFVVGDIVRGSPGKGGNRWPAAACLLVPALYVAMLILSLPVVRFWGMYLSFAGLAFLLIGTADPRGRRALHDHVSRRNGRNPSLAAAELGARAGDGRHHRALWPRRNSFFRWTCSPANSIGSTCRSLYGRTQPGWGLVHFSAGNRVWRIKRGPKTWTCPFRAKGGQFPFSRREPQFSCDVLSAAKIESSPVNRVSSGDSNDSGFAVQVIAVIPHPGIYP